MALSRTWKMKRAVPRCQELIIAMLSSYSVLRVQLAPCKIAPKVGLSWKRYYEEYYIIFLCWIGSGVIWFNLKFFFLSLLGYHPPRFCWFPLSLSPAVGHWTSSRVIFVSGRSILHTRMLQCSSIHFQTISITTIFHCEHVSHMITNGHVLSMPIYC